MSSNLTQIEVLILSPPVDAHAVAVSQHLTDMGVPHKIWSGEDFLRACVISYRLGDANFMSSIAMSDGTTLNLNALRSIWFRRPSSAQSLPMPELWLEQIMTAEASATLGGIYRSMTCVMVNHPGRDAECLHKLWQLEAAKRVGMPIPDTLVTNDPERAQNFVSECDQQVVYKFVSESSNHLFPRGEQSVGIPTLSMRQSDNEHLDQVRFGPHLFQRRLKKQFEVRVNVVGKKILAGRIDSQKEAARGKIDWRLDYGVPMAAYELPGDVSERCLNLMRLLGLNYGAMDFCVDEEGRHVFLECNCAGQFLWLEERANLPISYEMARLLAGRSEPLVVPGV